MLMQVSISSITIPPGQTPGTRLEGSKNPPSPRTIILYKNPPLWTTQGVKSPTSVHKVRKFHNVSIKTLAQFEAKSFVVSTNQTVSQLGDLIIYVYVIWQSSESNY